MKNQINRNWQQLSNLDVEISSEAQHFVFFGESPTSKIHDNSFRISNKDSLLHNETECSQEPERKKNIETTPIRNEEDFNSPRSEQSKLDRGDKRDDSLHSGSAVPLDECDVFFAIDEMGENSLGYFDGGVDYYNICWSYDKEKDCRDKKRIRKNIAKSITPTNTTRSISPHGVIQEMNTNAIEWYEQQKHHRQIFSMEKNFIEEVESPRWNAWNTLSPQSSSVILSECDETPSSLCSESNFDVQFPISSPLIISPKKTKEKNEYEVCTNLPEPDKEWYAEFFGRKPISLLVVNNSPDLFSRFSFRKSCILSRKTLSAHHSPTKQQLQIPQALKDALDDEELLFLGGYRDHGDGLFEC